MILRQLEELPGISVGGKVINNIRYADDTVLIATSQGDLQNLLNTCIEASKRYGLSMNNKKTYVMTVSKKQEDPRCNIVAEGQQLTQVSQVKYLGCLVTSDARTTKEVKTRIAQAKEAFNQLLKILKNI